MKKFYTILCLAIASLTQLLAQAPQGFNSQASVLVEVSPIPTASVISNGPPTVTAVGDQIYCPQSQQRIVTSFNIVDPDDTLIPAFYIQISSGYVVGQDQLSLIGSHPNVVANWNANQAKLTLTGLSGNSASYTAIIAAVKDVVFSSTNINVGPKTFSLTAGSANYLASTDHYYDYVPSNLISWDDAKVAAEGMDYFGLQGYLATLTIPDEGQISGELSPGTGWIGASDVGSEGVWKWMTGPEAGMTFWNGNENGSVAPGMYANWNSGEPNNYGSGEDYAHITFNTGIPGSWNDLPNNTNGQPANYQAKGYVIEYGGTPGDPVLNISDATTFSPPQILSTTQSESCGNDPSNLSVTSNTTDILWYDSQNGGTLLHTGNTYNPILTTTTTFWILPSSNGCTTGTRTAVTATVYSVPVVDTPADVSSCDNYTLPALTNGTYFTSSNGNGTPLNGGDVISASTTLFVYAETATTPNCFDEHSFDIIINSTPTIDTPADVSSCDSYTLPALTNGSYFTASNGGGTPLSAGDVISASTTLFVYAESATTPICTNEHSFDITINTTPAIDTPADVSSCDNYTLPALTNGTYFTASNGNGTPLNSGDVISASTTLFVYAETATTPNCFDEHSFDITINTTPVVDTPADIFECDSYTLPALTNGNYFTASNGGGTPLNAGDVISTSTTLFVYAETATTPNCSDEHSFDVTINITSNATFVQIPPICEGDSLTLQTTSIEGFSGTWSPVFDNTTSGTYTFTPDSDQCAIGTTMDVIVYPVFTPTFTQVNPICVGDVLVDLPIVSNNGFNGTWSPAINNTVTTEYTFTPAPPVPGVCFDETKMTIEILTQTIPQFTQIDPICIGSTLAPLNTTSNEGITGTWTPSLNNLATTAYTFTPDPYQCAEQTTMNIVVNPISVLTISATNQSEDFDANQMILVSATGGSGTYEYQLDSGAWQSSSIFEYVTGCQEHTVAVRDAFGCSTIPEATVMIMEFPKSFTPNGDGYNDTWNIKCLRDDPTALVSVFDRFGKLLFQFSPNRTAWNGTFNGNLLSTSDYWFVVNYTNSDGVKTQYRSHFSLRY
jgi:gliding motility-associated-like protein